MTRALENKTAIVTGGAGGVAKGVAAAFVKAGASVLIVDRDEAMGRAAAAELGEFGSVQFMALDLANHAELPSIVDAAVASFGKLDVLVNAAQASRQKMFMEQSREDANVAFDTGFWPTFILMQAAYPHLLETRGSVINFGSGAGYAAQPTQASYAAAKEAIRAISRVACHEWGPHGIRVNVLCPFANSPGVQTWAEQFPEAHKAQLEKVPLRRIGDCEKDIGAAAVFLASDAAAYVTGQTLMVDGGSTRIG
jgi:NAD(P)-dependent dehydrogenase (short-subunit alcohol dehydrogenase family)